MDPTYPLVPIVNFFACVLVLASMSKGMFQSWNVGVCSFAIWVAITSFIVALNSILWASSIENIAPVWCDIVTRLQVGSLAAIPAASLVIIRRLSLTLRQRDHSSLKSSKKLDLLVDLSLCLGTPIILMAMSYIVQVARFVIIEQYGCTEASVNAGLTIVINSTAPIVFSILSLTLYTPRLIRTYFKTRELDELLSDTHLDRRGFSKLLVLGLFDILVTLPIALIFLFETIFQSGGGLKSFWPGWRATHLNISSVLAATWHEWESAGWAAICSVRIGQWTNPLFAVIFFALFGLTEANKLWYRCMYWKVMKPFGFTARLDPVASDIEFGSGPVQGSGTSGVLTATTTKHTSCPNTEDHGRSFNDATEIEEARRESFGTQTMVVSLSLTKVDSKDT